MKRKYIGLGLSSILLIGSISSCSWVGNMAKVAMGEDPAPSTTTSDAFGTGEEVAGQENPGGQETPSEEQATEGVNPQPEENPGETAPPTDEIIPETPPLPEEETSGNSGGSQVVYNELPITFFYPDGSIPTKLMGDDNETLLGVSVSTEEDGGRVDILRTPTEDFVNKLVTLLTEAEQNAIYTKFATSIILPYYGITIPEGGSLSDVAIPEFTVISVTSEMLEDSINCYAKLMTEEFNGIPSILFEVKLQGTNEWGVTSVGITKETATTAEIQAVQRMLQSITPKQ